jgi:uncharacterized membrane protein
MISFIPAVGWMLSGPFTAGYIRCLLRIRANEPLDYNDLFWGFSDLNRFIHLVLVSFLASALTIVGLICLIIPGIYLMVATMVSTQVMVLQNLDAVESIKKSMALVRGRWWWFSGLTFIIGFLNVIGALFFLLGLFITIPLSNLVLIHVVEMLSDKKETPRVGSLLAVNPEV